MPKEKDFNYDEDLAIKAPEELEKQNQEPKEKALTHLEFFKALEQKMGQNPIAKMILGDQDDKITALEKLTDEVTGSKTLEQILEPPKRKEGEETLNILELSGAIQKIFALYKNLLDLSPDYPDADRIMRSIHQLIRGNLTEIRNRWKKESNREKKYQIECVYQKTSGSIGSMIKQVLKECQENPFPPDLLIELRIEPDVALDKMTNEQIVNILKNLPFPRYGIAYTMPDADDKNILPQTVQGLRGKKNIQWENMKDWFREFFSPISDPNISEADEQRIAEVLKEILETNPKISVEKQDLELKNRIISMSKMILETKDLTPSDWQECLNKALPSSIEIKEVKDGWKILFSDGTTEYIEAEKGESPGSSFEV